MRVTGWSNGSGVYGLRVGHANRDKFFDPNWRSIAVEIESEWYEIPISGGFWRHCPEIRAPIIRDWLRQHLALEWPQRRPPVAELTPLVDNRFRLELPT